MDATLGIPLPSKWNYRLKLRVLWRWVQSDGSVADNDAWALWRYRPIRRRNDLFVLVPGLPRRFGARISSGRLNGSRLFAARSGPTIALPSLGRFWKWLPATGSRGSLERVRSALVVCVICGAGHLNIDHARSGLHSRIEAGVLSLGGYHSVNTGKFTTAPMFASSVARRVLAFAQSGEAAQGDR